MDKLLREEFEDWMRSTGETPSAFMEHNGCYVDSRVQIQWMAFRAGYVAKSRGF